MRYKVMFQVKVNVDKNMNSRTAIAVLFSYSIKRIVNEWKRHFRNLQFSLFPWHSFDLEGEKWERSFFSRLRAFVSWFKLWTFLFSFSRSTYWNFWSTNVVYIVSCSKPKKNKEAIEKKEKRNHRKKVVNL